MDQERKIIRPVNPKESANLFSTVTFFYNYVLLKAGYKTELQEKDIYDIIPSFQSQKLGDRLERKWAIEKVNHSKPSVYRLLRASFLTKYLLFGLVQLIMRTTVILVQPRALGKLVSFFKKDQDTMTLSDAYYYGGLLIFINIINCIYNHNYMQYITEFAIRVRTSFSSLIYRKALNLSSTSLSEITLGRIVTLITKDVFAFDSALIFMNDMWIGVIQTFIISCLIYTKVGFSVFAGIGVLLMIIPLQVYLGKKSSSIRLLASKKTDERVQVTQETFSAIKIIKMYTWEKFFGDDLTQARKNEVNKMRKIYYIKALNLCIGGLCGKISFYFLIMCYIWMGNVINADKVFFVLSCFQSLRSYITISIPVGISQSGELVASIKRIQEFLLAKEISTPSQKANSTLEPRIYLKNVAVKIKDTEVLKNVSLDAENGLMLITGPLGSGKSSLLKTILQEYEITQGNININGTISYAPQEPWLFPSSIKQNILFGQKYKKERYETVLKVCALTLDINLLEKGDNTIVGDRGINLSKGQQARINLARAVYKDSDIYLLDDTLTALDASVNNYVFQECIKGFLHDKLCLLVTHNINHLKQVNNILAIENGKTLSLDRQREMLDKRITYYMDDAQDEEYLDCVDNKSVEETNELDPLINKEETVKNIYHEEKKTGKVNFEVYKQYSKYYGGLWVLILILFLFITCQISISYSEKLVSIWVNKEERLSNYKYNSSQTMNITQKNFTETSIPPTNMFNDKNSTNYDKVIEERNRTLTLYTTMIILSTVLTLVRAITHFYFASKASENLHKYMALSVLYSHMRFFDTHFLGNIITRFSKDLATIDEYIPFIIFENLRSVLTLIGILLIIATVNLVFLIPGALICITMYYIRKFYIPTGRSLKRLDASTRSPVIGYINATLEGLTTIRAYEKQHILKNEFDRHQDLFTSASFMMTCTSRAFGFFIDMICSFLISTIILYSLTFGKDIEAGSAGLAITQSFMLTGLLQWTIRQWADIENNLTAVERVLEYVNVEKESTTSGMILKNWPENGEIRYNNVSLYYNTSIKEPVLKSINFVVEANEKIGIIGRTGAGKSSIIASLFRLYDVEGEITIDNVNIKNLCLDFLRSSIGIIPQDPVLFSGSVRSNIDPIGKYSDSEIWGAIQKVELNNLVPSLDYEITESGSNFSSGQRQLICLARAMVSKNKIIVLDEATVNMDPETDTLLHKVIKDNFKNCTVLTIAHKLHYVMEYDKVMVVDGGQILEFDTTDNLMSNKEGAFYKLVKQGGME